MMRAVGESVNDRVERWARLHWSYRRWLVVRRRYVDVVIVVVEMTGSADVGGGGLVVDGRANIGVVFHVVYQYEFDLAVSRDVRIGVR